MSYNPNIPIVTDNTRQSAPQIRANFQQINAAWAENHVGLTSTEPQGKHEVLTLRAQTGDPTTAADQTAIYNKLVSTIPNLFFRPNSNQSAIQMTYPSISNSNLTQYTFAAGPFIIYGGFINTPTIGQTVNLSPGSSLIYVDLTMTKVTGVPNNTLVVPTNVSGTSFKITYLAPITGTISVYYFAIGLP